MGGRHARRLWPAMALAALAVTACPAPPSPGVGTGDGARSAEASAVEQAAPQAGVPEVRAAPQANVPQALVAPSIQYPADGPSVGGCPLFPADNPWNTRVDTLPVNARSADWVANIGATGRVHPDFGTFWQGAPIGIPFTTVGAGQPKVPVTFDYVDESDPGPYPIPANAPIEGGAASSGDRHVIVVDTSDCKLYEMWSSYPVGGGTSWTAGSGAVFDLTSNTLRPAGWTSADAAGLPVLPGLVRYDEVQAGAINHALRFTVQRSQRGYIAPATHFASSSSDPTRPPMGARFRLKASYDCTSMSSEAKVVCTALKQYGMIVADNGSNWYISGEHDPRWNDDALSDLGAIPGSAFEAVQTGAITTG